MNRLLNILLILSFLFMGTVNGSGIDVGAANCHDHESMHAGGHGPMTPEEGSFYCDCDCPCCDYWAHFIPLLSLSYFGVTMAPVGANPSTLVAYQSSLFPPPTPPPIG